jgi:16S rRNA (guanine527-N7)-methyltransferase
VDDARERDVIEKAAAFGLELDSGRAAAMIRYLDALLALNEEINLTAVRDPSTAHVRHVVDSLAFALHARGESEPPRRVLDFGSGGGFPGVPIAIAYPEATVALLDGTRKKVAAVEKLRVKAGVANVRPIWGRGEDLAKRRDRMLYRACDAVVVRAVGPLLEILGRAGPFVAVGGALVCWKSPTTSSEERAAADSEAARIGFEALPDMPYVSDAPSNLVRYRRVARHGGLAS